MSYVSLEECLVDLEKNGQLVRIKEEVDPYLEMAAIHLRVHEASGPALVFENVSFNLTPLGSFTTLAATGTGAGSFLQLENKATEKRATNNTWNTFFLNIMILFK